MSILKSISHRFPKEGDANTMVQLERMIDVLSKDNEFVEEVLRSFSISQEQYKDVVPIPNLKFLIDDLELNDSKIEKIDVPVLIRNVYAEKFLKNEAAIFNLVGLKSPEFIKTLGKDSLEVETCYSAKTDFFELFHMGNFVNYWGTRGKDDLIQDVLEKLRNEREDKISARLVRLKDDGKYFLRAITSESGYKKYGINFSLMIAVLSLWDYMKRTNEQVYISNYQVDESKISVSFSIARNKKISDKQDISFNLILKNDEIKESSVSMNACFRLIYREDHRETYLDLLPSSYSKSLHEYKTDMLSYTHAMKVTTVCEKVSHISEFIDEYVKQVSVIAPKIIDKKNPAEIKEYVIKRISLARTDYFTKYKEPVVNKLISIDVNTVFDLFEALRSVEELFGDDIQSRMFWQSKMYDIIVNGGQDQI